MLQGERPSLEQLILAAGTQLAASVALPPSLGLSFLTACLEMTVLALERRQEQGVPFLSGLTTRLRLE